MIAVMKMRQMPTFLFHDVCSVSNIGRGKMRMYKSDTTLIVPMTTNGTCVGLLLRDRLRSHFSSPWGKLYITDTGTRLQ